MIVLWQNIWADMSDTGREDVILYALEKHIELLEGKWPTTGQPWFSWEPLSLTLPVMTLPERWIT